MLFLRHPPVLAVVALSLFGTACVGGRRGTSGTDSGVIRGDGAIADGGPISDGGRDDAAPGIDADIDSGPIRDGSTDVTNITGDWAGTWASSGFTGTAAA